MKSTIDREKIETFVSIFALGFLSLVCVFVKYDWHQVARALAQVFL